MFDQWVAHRNRQTSENGPTNLLTTVHPTGAVDNWLATLILEAHREDCKFNPPNTIRNIVPALFDTKANLGVCNVPNMIDKKGAWDQLSTALQHKQLHSISAGVHNIHKHKWLCLRMKIRFGKWGGGVGGTQTIFLTLYFPQWEEFYAKWCRRALLYATWSACTTEHSSGLHILQIWLKEQSRRYTCSWQYQRKVVTILHKQKGRSCFIFRFLFVKSTTITHSSWQTLLSAATHYNQLAANKVFPRYI